MMGVLTVFLLKILQNLPFCPENAWLPVILLQYSHYYTDKDKCKETPSAPMKQKLRRWDGLDWTWTRGKTYFIVQIVFQMPRHHI